MRLRSINIDADTDSINKNNDRLMRMLVMRANSLAKQNNTEAVRGAASVEVTCRGTNTLVRYDVVGITGAYTLTVVDIGSGTVWFKKSFSGTDVIPTDESEAVVLGWAAGHSKAFADAVTSFCKRVRFLTNQYEHAVEQASLTSMPRQETE